MKYLKTDRTLFPEKFIFPQILGKFLQNGPKIGFLDFLKNFVTGFSWKYSEIKTSIFINISPPITYLAKFWFSSYGLKCCWRIKLQDSLKCNISGRSEQWSLFLTWRKTSKFSTSWFYHIGCVYLGMPKVPKIRILHIFAISLEKYGRWSWGFLPPVKYEVFLQRGSIILDVRN